MAKNEPTIRKAVFVVPMLGLSCILLISVWSGGVSSGGDTKSIQTQKDIVLGSKTHSRSLEIIKAELNRDGRLVHIAIKNISDKNIDWFRISLGAGSDVEADFAFAEKPILAPGDVYEDQYPVDSKSNEVRITIVSLLFEDNASDGDLHYVQLVREKRLGQRIELSRIVPLLRKANTGTLLENLETEVSDASSDGRIPAAQSDLKAEARLIGVRNARTVVLNDIRRIKTLEGQDRGKELTKLEERYNSISFKLTRHSF